MLEGRVSYNENSELRNNRCVREASVVILFERPNNVRYAQVTVDVARVKLQLQETEAQAS